MLVSDSKISGTLVKLGFQLQEAFETGQINARAFQRRKTYLQKLSHQNESLQHLQKIITLSEDQQMLLGLPSLNQCNAEEKQMCLNFLLERRKLLDQLYQDANKVLLWAEKAKRQHWLGFLQAFTLARLKKRLSILEYWLVSLQEENQTLDEQITALADVFKDKFVGKQFESNIQAMVAVFNDLDKIATRIHKLQQRIAGQENEIQKMRAWLDDHTKSYMAKNTQAFTLKQPPESYVLPPPQDALSDPLSATSKKVVLIKQFLETYLENLLQDNVKASDGTVLDFNAPVHSFPETDGRIPLQKAPLPIHHKKKKKRKKRRKH